MNEIQSTRFKDAPWFPTEDTYVLIGGSGGIGSWLTVMLARAGFLPVIYDFDVLEEHNMGGQLFPKSQIGKPKVEALANIVKDFTGTEVVANNEKYTSETMSNVYVFSAFDNMQARKDTFNNWKEHFALPWLEWKKQQDSEEDLPEACIVLEDTSEPIFIDGRLTMEQLQIFCVTPDKIEEYEKHLFDDAEVEEAPCTLKQTSHSAAMIASHMTGFFTNHVANVNIGDDDRTVPFFWEYFIPINYVNEQC